MTTTLLLVVLTSEGEKRNLGILIEVVSNHSENHGAVRRTRWLVFRHSCCWNRRPVGRSGPRRSYDRLHLSRQHDTETQIEMQIREHDRGKPTQ